MGKQNQSLFSSFPIADQEKYPSFDKDKDVLILPLDVTKFSTHTDLANQVIHRFGKVRMSIDLCHGVINSTFADARVLLHDLYSTGRCPGQQRWSVTEVFSGKMSI